MQIAFAYLRPSCADEVEVNPIVRDGSRLPQRIIFEATGQPISRR